MLKVQILNVIHQCINEVSLSEKAAIDYSICILDSFIYGVIDQALQQEVDIT